MRAPLDSGRPARVSAPGWRGLRRVALLAALAAAATAVLGLPGSSRAAGCTITWVGDVNGNWYGGTSGADTNWSNNLYPSTTDDVCINNTGAQPVTVDGNT